MLTKEDVQNALPANLKSAATQALADHINNICNDPIVAEEVRNNFISYAYVLKEGKFKTEDYLSAVMYVSHKLMGMTNQDAYFKTFPNRHANFMANGTSSKDISSYVSAYHKGKLVNLIMEQVLTPTWVLNQELFQKAVNTQAEIMLDPDVSAKVRSDAANSLMTHLKKPETKAAEIKIDLNESSGMNEMREALTNMAKLQQDMLANGLWALTVVPVCRPRLIWAARSVLRLPRCLTRCPRTRQTVRR